MHQLIVNRRVPGHIALLAALFFGAATCAAQGLAPTQQDLAQPPVRWAEVASSTEQTVIDYDTNTLLRYKVRKTDSKGVVLRQVIESREGSVARLLRRDGQALTADEDKAERKRLQDILDDPDAWLRHTHREDGSKSYAAELLHNMPRAMLWSYVPNQPQLPNSTRAAVVLDFRPDPQFKPPSLITETLTGIAGRLWVDTATHHVTRIEGRILHPVDFGWGGFLARIKEGGVIELEQQPAPNGRWLYSHLIEHLTIREVLIHTAQENSEMVVTEVQPLPAPIDFREAVQRLLALDVPTR